jgi:hypothetical protein
MEQHGERNTRSHSHGSDHLRSLAGPGVNIHCYLCDVATSHAQPAVGEELGELMPIDPHFCWEPTLLLYKSYQYLKYLSSCGRITKKNTAQTMHGMFAVQDSVESIIASHIAYLLDSSISDKRTMPHIVITESESVRIQIIESFSIADTSIAASNLLLMILLFSRPLCI